MSTTAKLMSTLKAFQMSMCTTYVCTDNMQMSICTIAKLMSRLSNVNMHIYALLYVYSTKFWWGITLVNHPSSVWRKTMLNLFSNHLS